MAVMVYYIVLRDIEITKWTELFRWCEEQFGFIVNDLPRWWPIRLNADDTYIDVTFYFKYKEDYTLFRLRWT